MNTHKYYRYLSLIIILIYINQSIHIVNASCPAQCLCVLGLINLCSITQPLAYALNEVLDITMKLTSSLSITNSIVTIKGDLVCDNGQIILLSGALVIDGNLSILTGCKISVNGPSSITVGGPVIMQKSEFTYSAPSNPSFPSKLQWFANNISLEISAFNNNGILSSMEFLAPNAIVNIKNSASPTGAIQKIGSLLVKMASSLSLAGLTFGNIFIDSCQPPSNINLPMVDYLSIFNTNLTTGITGTFTQLNLTQSNALFDKNSTIGLLLTTNSILSITNGASTVVNQATITQSSQVSGLAGTVSTVTLLGSSILNLGTQISINALSLSGSSTLNPGSIASISTLTSIASTVNAPLGSTLSALTATLTDSLLSGGLSQTCNLLNMTNSNALLNRVLSLGNLVGNSSQLNITNVGVTIQSLLLSNTSLVGGSGLIQSAVLNQNSKVNLNLPTVINGLVSTVSNILVSSPLGNLTLLGNSHVTDSGVGLLDGSLLNLGGTLTLLTTSPQDTVTMMHGGGLLVLGSGAKLALKASLDVQLRLDAQIKSLGGIIDSVASLQLVTQLLPIDSLTVVAQSLLVDSGLLKLSNCNLSILETLGFRLVKGVLDLASSTIDVAGSVLVSLTDLVVDDVAFNLQDQVIPDRITLDLDTTLTVGSGGLGLTAETKVNVETAGQNNTLYTVVYSPYNAILCDDTVVGNSSDYTFICDNRLIAVKFSNCSRFQCPNDPNRCVDSINNCPVNGTCSLANFNYTCWNGECHQNISTCPPLPACPVNQTRCASGICVVDPTICPICNGTSDCPAFKYNGCPIGKYQCMSGSCVSNLTDCCQQNCEIAPSLYKTVEIKSPINSTRNFIVPIISEYQDKLAIYGYIHFPANFYGAGNAIQEYVHLKQSEDSYLDSISGGSLFNISSNTTFRDSVKSLTMDITLGNYLNPTFTLPIQFELKKVFQQVNHTYLTYINETKSEWNIVTHSPNSQDNNQTGIALLPPTNLILCGKYSNHTCGNTTHFTNFGVLLYLGEDDDTGGNGSGELGEKEVSEESKWLKKVLVPVSIAVGGAALMSIIVGFFVSKIIRHGRLKYWWASRGASSEHINQDAEMSEVSN